MITRKIAWFHCFAGIAGDMALGSLIDAGADVGEVREMLARLPLAGWELDVEPVLRAGIAATRAVVSADDDVVVRTHAHIVGLIEEARLPERVARRSLAIFGALAEAEAHLHRRPADQVHFHEVGGHDTVIDVVGTAAAMEVLGVDEVNASAVTTGTGMIRAAHGFLPNPSPAVVRLLHGVPTVGRNVGVELTTPTGAAILAATASSFGPMPALTVQASGFGAGSKEIDGLPNCTQVVIGDAVADSTGGEGQPVVLLETNVDDATGETIAHAVSALLEAGAHDVWVTPVVMKKGRSGHVVSALADPAIAGDLRALMRAELGTIGVRGNVITRWPATREMDLVEVDGHAIRVKVSPGRVKAEHRDAARVAARTGQPLREVAARAEAAWRVRATDHRVAKRAPGPRPVLAPRRAPTDVPPA